MLRLEIPGILETKRKEVWEGDQTRGEWRGIVKVTLGLWLRWPGGQWQHQLEEGQVVVEVTGRHPGEDVPGVPCEGKDSSLHFT